MRRILSPVRLPIPTLGHRVLHPRVYHGLFERKVLLLDQRFPHGEKIRSINSEDANSDAPDLSPGAEDRPDPLEVILPTVDARMEEAKDCPSGGICSRDVRTFVAIAMKTRQGEVFKNSLASVLDGQ